MRACARACVHRPWKLKTPGPRQRRQRVGEVAVSCRRGIADAAAKRRQRCARASLGAALPQLCRRYSFVQRRCDSDRALATLRESDGGTPADLWQRSGGGAKRPRYVASTSGYLSESKFRTKHVIMVIYNSTRNPSSLFSAASIAGVTTNFLCNVDALRLRHW